MPTPLRNIRVPADLWDAALREAELDDRNVSEVIRELLARWVKQRAKSRA